MPRNVTYIFGISVLMSPVVYKLYRNFVSVAYHDTSKVSLIGKTVIVTGANTGIGYETALECAKRGARLIVACRSESKGTEAVENITRLSQNKEVVLKLLDLASLNSVNKFAKDILKDEERLDILINNAGAFWLGDRTTEDGFQLEMQVNYIAPVLLTLLLLDLLKGSSSSRIVNVSSKAARAAKKFTSESLNVYTGHVETYANTKLANILFTQELAKKLEGTKVSVFSLHPGVIRTKLGQNMNPVLRVFGRCFSYFFLKGPADGCQTTLYTALEPGIEHLSGRHFDNCKVVDHYPTARDPVLSKKIWDETMKLLKFDDKQI